MKCRNCGLINPETAARCDCGYDFATQTVLVSNVPGHDSPRRRMWLHPFIHTAVVFVGIGPSVGFFASFYIRAALTEGVRSLSAIDLGFIGFLPLAYSIGSIPALGTGLLYAFLRLILPPRMTQSWFWRAVLCGAIGTAVTGVYWKLSGLNGDIILWAGLPASVVCGILDRNRIE